MKDKCRRQQAVLQRLLLQRTKKENLPLIKLKWYQREFGVSAFVVAFWQELNSAFVLACPLDPVGRN